MLFRLILHLFTFKRGQTNHVVWDIAKAIYLIKGDCYFVIHSFFPIILAPTLWFGEKRDGQPRSTSGDCSSPPTLRLSHLSLYLCCITSSNKPSIQPSDPTWQVALISTSRITTTTTTEKYTTQSLYEQFRNKLKSNTSVSPHLYSYFNFLLAYRKLLCSQFS